MMRSRFNCVWLLQVASAALIDLQLQATISSTGDVLLEKANSIPGSTKSRTDPLDDDVFNIAHEPMSPSDSGEVSHVELVQLKNRSSERPAYEVFGKLLENDEKAGTPREDDEKILPIVQAVEAGDLAKVKQLLDEDPKLLIARTDSKGHKNEMIGFTPLHFAAGAGKKEIVEELLKRGHDGDILNVGKMRHYEGNGKDVTGLEYIGTPLYWGGTGYSGIGQSDRHYCGTTPLYMAAGSGHEDVVEILLKEASMPQGMCCFEHMNGRKNAYIEATDACGHDFSPLTNAVLNGNRNMVKFLMDGGAKVDVVQGLHRMTPLMVAAYYCKKEKRIGCAEVAQLLLDQPNHGNIDATNTLGETALICAAQKGNTEVAKRLIENGAKKDVKDKEQKTALEYAERHKNEELIKILSSSALPSLPRRTPGPKGRRPRERGAGKAEGGRPPPWK